MKKLLVLFILLTLFLSGCADVVTPATDEIKIKSVIQEYLLAINDQNWSKVKSYCVYDSDIYYAVCQMEDLVNHLHSYCNIVTINTYVNILNVSIYGNYSKVHCYVITLISYCGYFASDSEYLYYHLQKIGNNWKLYQ